ncbi:4'-phosphopantetheinyl transferase [Kitasatospora sp. NPDC006697]|uniref:4'-phosphopantetheinyl transferase family protein n=1 Tax=Kitasatospora sp. NPDC006697 TaxID=3364020 RepID=UPI0036C26010
MLVGLLPGVTEVAEGFGEASEAGLFPEEAAEVANAVEKRRQEFAGVRECARTALGRLGVPPQPLLHRGEGPGWAAKAPRWPDGIVGSMTHCQGYRGAVVARVGEIASVGVDAEPHGPLPEGVEDVVTLPAEREALARLAAERPEVHWDRLLFSAKESVFKTWFPLTDRWLGFEECELIPAADGSFAARLLVPGPVVNGVELPGFRGRWRVAGGLVGTAIAVHADGTVA